MLPNKTGLANRYMFKQIIERDRYYLWSTEKKIYPAFWFTLNLLGTYLSEPTGNPTPNVFKERNSIWLNAFELT